LALAKQDAETRNGIERPGWDPVPSSAGSGRPFTSDFKGGK
jgi:hypothetical protein